MDRRQSTLTDNTRVGHVQDGCDWYIGRKRVDGELNHLNNTRLGSPGFLGNPYPLEEYSRQENIEKYREDFEARLDAGDFRLFIREMAGDDLGCWCRHVDEETPSCHGDVIAEWADRL